MKRRPLIDSIVVVTPKNTLPFLCPFCHQIDAKKEYLRIHHNGLPNGTCIHSSCLLNEILVRQGKV